MSIVDLVSMPTIYYKKPTLCTFKDCLGIYVAIAPDGYLYTCQRFCGMPEFSVGHLSDSPTPESIVNSKGYAIFKNWHETARKSCSQTNCKHFEYCNGGCCYAALAAKKHVREWDGRDPFCKAYRTLFDELDDKITIEMGDELLKKSTSSPLLTIAEDRRREYSADLNSGRILNASQWQSAPGWVRRDRLETIFFNITYNCPFSCKHCWINAGIGRSCEISAPAVLKVIGEAFAAGFEKLVITGGEPLYHKDIHDILNSILQYRKLHRTPVLILQTTLAIPLLQERLILISECFDTINVSIDGTQEQHDERRGDGTYESAVKNILALKRAAPHIKVVLTPTLSRSAFHGAAGKAVRRLARELGNLSVEIRELKPMGRNREADDAEYTLTQDILYRSFTPKIKCGMGNILHIEPNGDIYPCYVFIDEKNYLGNALDENALEKAINSDIFTGWKSVTVDSTEKCASCDVRYICGGVCKIKADCDKEYRFFKKMIELAKQRSCV